MVLSLYYSSHMVWFLTCEKQFSFLILDNHSGFLVFFLLSYKAKSHQSDSDHGTPETLSCHDGARRKPKSLLKYKSGRLVHRARTFSDFFYY